MTVGLPNFFVSYKLSDGSLVNVQLIDTAGQERFRAINKSYYKKADCCLLVYDITDIKSFEDCKDYYNKHINDKCKEDIPVILLGNKTDLSSKRKVDSEDAANFAIKNKYVLFLIYFLSPLFLIIFINQISFKYPPFF